LIDSQYSKLLAVKSISKPFELNRYVVIRIEKLASWHNNK